MKKYSEFLNEQAHEPDLRKMDAFVKCIKSFDGQGCSFKIGKKYYISGMYGDPQGAVEKYGIDDYVPIECLSAVVVQDLIGRMAKFKVNEEQYDVYRHLPDFFEYFELSSGGSRFRKKITNKEVDPFGEENWWETSENFLTEQFSELDSRKIGKFVFCIKDFKSKMGEIIYEKGKQYRVLQIRADANKIKRLAQQYNYIPIGCLTTIDIEPNPPMDINYWTFRVEPNPHKYSAPSFFEYFEPAEIRNKITNTEVDPFGEEVWWETNEKYEDKIFKIGDIVKALDSYGGIFMYGKTGKIIGFRNIDKGHEPGKYFGYFQFEVKFDERFDHRQDYNNSLWVDSSNLIKLTSEELKERNEKIKEKGIKDKELLAGFNPYDEEIDKENWWETNEGILDFNSSLTEEEVKETLKKYSNQLSKNAFFETNDPHYVWCKGWFNKKIFISITKQFTDDGEKFFLYSGIDNIFNNTRVFRKTFTGFEECKEFLKNCNLEFGDMEQYQKRKRTTHTQEDPFDEEIWYEKEN